jgi:putative Mg2+ transporter-C (MgtC) family protein
MDPGQVIALPLAALDMAVALVCGAVIGSERQVRQRMAGLRTNALVALGAASFVIFSQLFAAEVSPTRVAAQVVSGIGFLGAGIIFRDGFNVHGLNTAATLWCSAAVGLMAGASAWPYALVLTALVVFINLGLRPLVSWLKRHTRAGLPVARLFRITLTCTSDAEAVMRGLLLRTLSLGGLHLSQIAATPVDRGVELVASLTGEGVTESALEQMILRLAAEPGVLQLNWSAVEEA